MVISSEFEWIDNNPLVSFEGDITFDEIEAISTLDKSASRWNEKIKFACVVQDDHIKKTILDYIVFMDDSSWETKIFNTVDEAIDWCKK